MTLADFDIIRRIGDGSFSEVMHVRDKKTGMNYALKMVDKHLIVRHKMVDHIKQVLPRSCTQPSTPEIMCSSGASLSLSTWVKRVRVLVATRPKLVSNLI